MKRSGWLRFNEQDGLYHGWHRGFEFTVPPATVNLEYRDVLLHVTDGARLGLNNTGPIEANDFAKSEALLKGKYSGRIGQDGIRWVPSAPWLSATGEWAVA